MIASQLKYIRHWKIKKASFESIENREATWYVDPPYQQSGKRYIFKKIDYDLLAKWCKERQGQVIVCEQNDANWLEFQDLKTIANASNNKYKELLWYKNYLDLK